MSTQEFVIIIQRRNAPLYRGVSAYFGDNGEWFYLKKDPWDPITFLEDAANEWVRSHSPNRRCSIITLEEFQILRIMVS